jgi:hypothetical protein
MIILNKTEDKMIGMQVRNIMDGEKRFYKIFEFDEIYNNVYKDNNIEESEAIPYNKLSHFYNILNVDMDSKITILEGYFDSIFIPNSVGMVGVNTDLSFLLNDNTDLDVRFLLDNDPAGYKESIAKIKESYSVFLWKKMFMDIAKKKKDYSDAMEYLNKIKDVNKFVEKCKDKNVYYRFDMNNYFSVDQFDMKYVDFKDVEKKKYVKRKDY